MRKKHKQNVLLGVLAVTFVLVSTIPDSAALDETTFGLQAKSVSLPRKNAYGDTLYALRPGGPQSAPKDVKLELPAHMSVTDPPTNQPGWPIYTENWHYPGCMPTLTAITRDWKSLPPFMVADPCTLTGHVFMSDIRMVLLCPVSIHIYILSNLGQGLRWLILRATVLWK